MDQPTEATNVDANIELLTRVDELIRSGFADRDRHPFADDAVFHFVNAQLPDLAGDYHGIDGIAHLLSVSLDSVKRAFTRCTTR